MTMTELPDMSASAEGPRTMPLGAFPRGLNVHMPAENSSPVDYAEALGEAYLSFAKHIHRKNGGHYLTPATIARFMANCSSYSEPHMRVLDPGSGTGILSAAVCEAASQGGTVNRLHVDAYENRPRTRRSHPSRSHLLTQMARSTWRRANLRREAWRLRAGVRSHP